MVDETDMTGSAAKEDFSPYNPEVSKLLYGGDSPSTDTRISSRVPLQASAENKAMKITAAEFYRLSNAGN